MAFLSGLFRKHKTESTQHNLRRNRKYDASLKLVLSEPRQDRRSISPMSKSLHSLTHGSVGIGGRPFKSQATQGKSAIHKRPKPKARSQWWIVRLFQSISTEEVSDNNENEVRHSPSSIAGFEDGLGVNGGSTAVIMDDSNIAVEHDQTLEEIANGDWTEAEIALFNRLNNRGFEPLLPMSWAMDFRTIPPALFSDYASEIFVNSVGGCSQFRTTQALDALMNLGVRTRERLDRQLRPEPILRREINSYIKWSQQDGTLKKKDFTPILAVVTRRPNEDVAEIVQRITAEMHEYGRQYRERWRVVESTSEEDPSPSKGRGKYKGKPLSRGREKIIATTQAGLSDRAGSSTPQIREGKGDLITPQSEGMSRLERCKFDSPRDTGNKRGVVLIDRDSPDIPIFANNLIPQDNEGRKAFKAVKEEPIDGSNTQPTSGPFSKDNTWKGGDIKLCPPTPQTATTTTTVEISTSANATSKIPKADDQQPSGTTPPTTPTTPTSTTPSFTDAEFYTHPLPTIYGMVIYNTTVSFVTYDAREPRKNIRTVCILDFGDKSQDVWNAFAVSILVITVRNYLVGLDPFRRSSGSSGVDPDA